MSKSANSHPRILLVTDEPFWRRESGSHNRVDRLYGYLCEQYPDTRALFLGSFKKGDLDCLRQRDAAPILNQYGSVGGGVPWQELPKWGRDQVERAWRSVKARLPGKPRVRLLMRPRRDYQRHFAHAVQQCQTDILVIERIRLSYLLDALTVEQRRRISAICDTIDVAHQRTSHLSAIGVQGGQISREQEVSLLRAYDGLIAIQDMEADLLREMAPGVPVITVRHAETVNALPLPEQREVVVGYIAKKNKQNQQAILDFIAAGWAEFRRAHHGRVTLQIAGSVCEGLDALLGPGAEGVLVRGRVDHVEAFYRSCDLIVNPIAVGSGLKIKNVEALCHGRPLITTRHGAIGLEDGANGSYIAVSSALDMYEPLSRLVQNPEARQDLARNAIAYAERAFAPETVYRPLQEWITCEMVA